eukprot:7013132-Prorocentrum_lima.AAC.1
MSAPKTQKAQRTPGTPRTPMMTSKYGRKHRDVLNIAHKGQVVEYALSLPNNGKREKRTMENC